MQVVAAKTIAGDQEVKTEPADLHLQDSEISRDSGNTESKNENFPHITNTEREQSQITQAARAQV